ncbi:MAG: hypothetical protein IJU74_09295 [Bacteroidales bacterium]|nr:hypothetical protein [Bacteroidales bacterium]MBR6932683.1 hypothetical protein [Bacteroidales bacterium]
MISNIPALTGLINTAGMVVIYYAFLRGMKELIHPLSALWWIAIGINLLGFVFFCLGEAAHGLSAASATLLPLIYLPLGILLLVWYRGRLGLEKDPGLTTSVRQNSKQIIFTILRNK